jgi:hypothetical protein
MFHLVARGADGRLLFRTWREGLALWDRVWRAVPDAAALVLMPDHLHLLHVVDVREALAAAASGFARWRNAARGERGRVFEALPPAEPLVDDDKRRRSHRYVHLNPCRARLVRDPLAWPLGTHRDAVGLAWDPVVRVRPDPERFHAWVSADPSVAVDGTPLPGWTRRTDDLGAVRDAVSAVTRTPLSALGRRGAARTLFLRAAAELCPSASADEAAALVGASRATAYRAAHARLELAPVVRALGDERFAPLGDGDLRRLPGWERYRGR